MTANDNVTSGTMSRVALDRLSTADALPLNLRNDSVRRRKNAA